MLARVIAKAFGVSETDAWAAYKKAGDWGVASLQIQNQNKDAKKSALEVSDVFDKLKEIAKDGGEGSQERKVFKLAELISQLDETSIKFVVRIPTGRLRLGFSDVTILDALSVMQSGDKSLRKELEGAFNVLADIGKIAKIFKTDPKKIREVESLPGVPIRPALCERLPTAEKVLEKLGNCVVEPKYDGMRIQVHVTDKGDISFFSRNLENTTLMFPDLVKAAIKEIPRGVIFDGEAIAVDPKTGKLLPFQETSQRKRKHDIDEVAIKIPVTVFLYDVLYANGETLLGRTYKERRAILDKLVDSKGKFVIARQRYVESAAELREEFDKAIKDGLEGLVAKKPDSIYQAGGRNFNWVKFKKTTESVDGKGLVDTIDCVVMGTYSGRGKRAGFGLGAFLVGVPGEPKHEIRNSKIQTKFYTICKIGTGLSDEQWMEMEKRSQKLKVSQKPDIYEVDKGLEPDVWMKPELVVEIMADEITRSRVHTAGMKEMENGESRGLALRFPRLIKFRDDKEADQATGVAELERLHKMQGV
jgi:DNA ligase 1